MAESFLVTGATGNVASLVVPQLLAKGAKVRALVRNAAKAADLKAKGAEIVIGDLEKPETLGPALDGITSVFLVTPPGPHAAEQAIGFLEVAKLSKTKPRIVRLSALKASTNGPTDNTRQHGRTDQAIQDSGLPFAILRPSLFMQNFFGVAESVLKEGVFYYGFGEGRVGMIDVRDIADAAAAVLLDRSWDYGHYELTGPASISLDDVAKELGAALGKPVKYIAVPPEAVEQSIKSAGMGDWFAGIMKDYSRAYAAGWGEYRSDFVQKMTGHPPRSFSQFAKEVFAPAMKR